MFRRGFLKGILAIPFASLFGRRPEPQFSLKGVTRGRWSSQEKRIGTIRIDDIIMDESLRFTIAQEKDDPAFRYLVESIRRDGLIRPIQLSQDNVLLSGFRRVEAAREVGLTEVPFERTNDMILAVNFDRIVKQPSWYIGLTDNNMFI